MTFVIKRQKPEKWQTWKEKLWQTYLRTTRSIQHQNSAQPLVNILRILRILALSSHFRPLSVIYANIYRFWALMPVYKIFLDDEDHYDSGTILWCTRGDAPEVMHQRRWCPALQYFSSRIRIVILRSSHSAHCLALCLSQK